MKSKIRHKNILNTPLGLGLDTLFDDFPPFSDDILDEVFEEQDHLDNILLI